ncbi:TetR/AcrR family transcriptional regulator [Bailinhaonella thermotolerans]|uniref:TetR/AcrR family transcriptional regulator n=1 Tax=Bailinhaonella thermotolerans TaxID=1070861 RepID=A0A3A4B6U8_9ACTN|nr:TetR/AcrR family transcriptional regulator [Bailinhaonella thermotolerans]RJL33951.1 TetR/AcrR family transcriptional regulator [Bailinhaonella thermotolerans]
MGKTAAETGARARTRRAILDAAISVLSRNPAASLGDVAAAAGMGRTTVHRYFPERSDLLSAIAADMLDKIGAATERARPGEGPADEVLDRLCQEYFELGDGLQLVFDEPQVASGQEWEAETDADRALLALVRRGQAEGTLDPEVDPRWAQAVLWSLLYSAWQHIREHGASKHDALGLCRRTLRKALAP